MGWIIEQKIIEERKAAEQPMKELQKIMTWYFEDMVNLKMNVEKLYRGVNRCLRLQEDALSRSVESIVIAEQKVKFREKTSLGFVTRIKREKLRISKKDKKVSNVNKQDFVKMIQIITGNACEELFQKNFRLMRHVSISKMMKCMGLATENSWIKGNDQIGERGKAKEEKIKLILRINKQNPRFKNYYNGKQCMKEYISQTLGGVERVQDKKKKFKARFMVDFIKGFRQNFEIKSGLNVNSLSASQVNK